MELKNWLNSINVTKKNLIDEDPSIEKEYPPYIINRCFSGHLDAILFANEMNRYNFLPKRMQYDFYIKQRMVVLHMNVFLIVELYPLQQKMLQKD